MSPIALPAIAAAALGLALSVTAFVRGYRRALNGGAFLKAVYKLVDAGEFDRLRKLCAAVGPQVALPQIVLEVVERRLPAVELESGGAFREAPGRVSFEERVRAEVEPRVDDALAITRRTAVMATLGVVLGGAGLMLFPRGLNLPLGVVAFVTGLAALFQARSIRRDLLRLRVELPLRLRPEEGATAAPRPATPAAASLPALPTVDEPAVGDAEVERHLLDGDHAAAAERLVAVAASDPSRATAAWLARARILEDRLVDPSSAHEALLRARETGRHEEAVLARLAAFYGGQRRWPEHIEVLERWRELRGDAMSRDVLTLHIEAARRRGA